MEVFLLPTSLDDVQSSIMFEYRVIITRILDGDTFDATVDLGFHTYSKQRFRLTNYSAPEIRGEEREMGLIAKQKLEEMLPVGSEWAVRSEKTEKFGRWLAEIAWSDGQSLSSYLISLGYGLIWNGKGKRPRFDPTVYPLHPPVQER